MIKAAILGTGVMAKHHVTHYKESGDVEIVACCDIRKEVAEAFAAEHGIPNVYTDLAAMLNSEQIECNFT